MAPHFEVLIPSFNCLEWLPTCFESIAGQTYEDYSVIVLDDASTIEGEAQYVKDYCDAHGWRWIVNGQNMRCPYNLRLLADLSGGDDDAVLLICDGDDFLLPGAVEHIATQYADPDLWLTWGSYTRWPDPSFMPNPAWPYPGAVMADRSFRAYQSCCFNHPLVFRRFLFDAISDAELQDDDGQWFQAGYDIAIMMPMLEMAGQEHARFLSECLYVYNEANGISDAKIRPEVCEAVHKLVRSRPVRERLIR